MGDEISINTGAVTKIFKKNNWVFGFSLTAFLILLLFLFVHFNISLGRVTNAPIFQLFSIFSSWFWIFLIISFVLAAIAAYYEKYTLMFLPLVIFLLFTTGFVRTQNIDQLKDITTGDWTLGPDLDPFLFLRNAIEISQGDISPIDHMRYAPLGTPNSYIYNNIMPWSIFLIYKIISPFTDSSITYSAIISPVIFFILSAVFFFLFICVLFSFKFSKEKSVLAATIATVLYIFSPAMLHRTVAGIPELESLGMVFFWLAFLFFILAWKQNDKKRRILFGILAGIFTGAMSWTWGGYRYIYLSIGFAVFLAFLFNIDRKKNFLIFISWIVPAILLEFLKIRGILGAFFSFSDTGFVLGILFIMIVDKLIYGEKIRDKLKLSRFKLPRSIISILLSLIILIVGLLIINPSFLFSIFSNTAERLLHPLGSGRVGLTVAENRAPYFTEVFQNFGYFFWAFFVGAILMFYEATKHFNKKNRIKLNFFFVIFITTFIFSRVSSDHLLNGDNFISRLSYFGGLALFGIILFHTYIKSFKKKDDKTLQDFREIKFSYILILAFVFLAIVSMRGAIRLFFIISPLLIIIVAFFVVRFSEYTLGRKESSSKILSGIFFLLIMVLLFNTFAAQAILTAQSAQATVPSTYNQQWQRAMSWVRENTAEGSIFTHWWDYGYWVQSLGERPTVSDGGHYIGYWDHTIGRYLLTTPEPKTALSLLKTHEVSYLLIDSSDLGKYPAYASIGSDESEDRNSQIPLMLLDSTQTRRTNNSEIRLYQGATLVDEDIIYNTEDGQQIFLPRNGAVIGGVILNISETITGIILEQPQGVFFYNNQQINLPIRYLNYNGETLDFGDGLEATVKGISQVGQSAEGLQVDQLGAVIYLSPKVSKSLFAQLYLLDDSFGNYETINLVHVQPDPLIEELNNQGAGLGDFAYISGFRGPIKIWDTRNIPENILVREEFLRNVPIGENIATLDSLEFSR